jgi:hypothetical protein
LCIACALVLSVGEGASWGMAFGLPLFGPLALAFGAILGLAAWSWIIRRLFGSETSGSESTSD